jgi:hypothetical protein
MGNTLERHTFQEKAEFVLLHNYGLKQTPYIYFLWDYLKLLMKHTVQLPLNTFKKISMILLHISRLRL